MKISLPLLLVASTALTVPSPALAQAASGGDVAAELAELRAQMGAMAERIESLEAELDRTRQTANNAEQVALKAADSPPPVAIAWKGAPELKTENGFSFKPRGRIQADAGFVNAPDSIGASDGFGSELRRARLGMQGDIPGGFGYKFEVDFAGDEVTLADAILSYETGGLTLNVGQHNNFQSLEELTSSLFSSFMERAAFTDAFGFERRLGVSAEYSAGDILLQAGVFSDNNASLPDGTKGADGRIVYSPKMGRTQFHLGGSLHYTDLPADTSLRYRQRPMVHFTGDRFIDTGSMAASSETGYGVELAAIHGPFHAAAEGYWQKVELDGPGANPTFFGGYAEAGLFLTKGDTRGYKGGKFDRVRPASPVGEGGIGAVQLNVRYDRLDLVDANIFGGSQNQYAVSLVWTPTDYTRFMLNYARNEYANAARPTSDGSRSYAVDVVGARAQVDF